MSHGLVFWLMLLDNVVPDLDEAADIEFSNEGKLFYCLNREWSQTKF